MAAIVTGLIQINAADHLDWVSALVGDADTAIPFATSGSNSPGIDGTTKPQQAANQGTALVVGDHYSLWSGNFAASATYDFSAPGKAITLHIRNLSPTFTALDDSSADAYKIYLFSGGGSANYAVYNIQGSVTLNNGLYYPVTVHSTLEDATGGTFDSSDITGIGMGIKASQTYTFGFQFAIDQVVLDDGVVFEDTGTPATVTMDDYFNLCRAEGGELYHSLLVVQAGTTYEFGFGFSLEADDYNDSAAAVGIAFKAAAPGFVSPPSGFYAFNIIGQVSGSIIMQNMTAATLSPDFSMTIDGSAASTVVTVTSGLVAGVSDVIIAGTGTTITGVTLSSPSTVDISDSDLDIIVLASTSAIDWSGDLVAGSTITTDSDLNITFAETDLSDINLIFTANNSVNLEPLTSAGTYDLSGAANTGFTTDFDIPIGNTEDTTVVLSAEFTATRTDPTTGGGSITLTQPALTFTFNSDTASTLIRYFEDDSQTVVDSATGTTLAYEYPDTDPVDAEFVKQGYVPVNRQDVVPSDGGTLDIIMDFDEAYSSAHGLTITSEYDYVRATKVLTINSDQEALDVRSSLADVIRTNSGYYNTALLMVAIPGLTRVDLTNGATITSMATWKGAGMEMFDAADALNPVEKWFAIKSVGTITGATTHYRQTDSGSSTAVTLTSNVVNEAFQYWDDPNHDGSAADGFDYSDYMVVKSFLAGSKQGRIDIFAASGLTALNSNLFTVPLSNEAHDYSVSDPGITADITLIAGGTEGGVAFSYEIVDGGTNTGEDMADQWNYNAANNPNTVIPGGTGLTYFELGNAMIHNATAVETEAGFEEGTAPAQVGFYASRGGADHPDFTRFQGDNGTYYTPLVQNQATITNLTTDGADILLQIYNNTTANETYAADPGGATYNEVYTEGANYSEGDEIRVRFAELNGAATFKSFETIVTAGPAGWSLNAANFIVSDSVYATNAVDGSLVSKFTYSPVGDQFNLVLASNFLAAELFAFYCYTLTTVAGIEGAFGSFVAENEGSYKNITGIANIFLDNETTSSKRQTDTARIYKDDGAYPVLDPTTSGFGIDVNWQNVVYVVTTGGSSLTVPQEAQLLQAAEAQEVNTKIATPVVSVSADILAVKAVADLGSTQVSVDAIPTAIENRQEMDANSTQLAAILTDTGTTIPADTAAIKAKTDELTFTKAGEVDSNGKSVNDTTVTGSGTDVDPWGP